MAAESESIRSEHSRSRESDFTPSRLTFTCFSQMLEVARAVQYIHSLGLVLCWLRNASGVSIYIVD